ncbi:MAG: TatD family hydrolase [Elusimicrobiota bacterium]
MSLFTDTHVHLGDPQFDADRNEVFSRAAAAGVKRIVEIADHPDEWSRAVEIARSRPNEVRCALGLHPYYADQFDGDFPQRLRAALAAAPEAVAIGEIGLDYSKTDIPHDVQLKAFSALVRSGMDWDVPLVVHCRDAYQDLVPILEDLCARVPATRRFRGVIHCFTGTPDDAAACVRLGFALGADGPITYKKNDSLREAFRRTGPDCTVLETDCPYLPPQSSRGKRNEPLAVVEIAEKLAAIWGLSLDETAHRTSANAAALFRWPESAI